MTTPEDRAAKKIEEATNYSPIDEEEAKKRAMIAEIVDTLNKESSKRVAMILDQVSTHYEESETWHDDGPVLEEPQEDDDGEGTH